MRHSILAALLAATALMPGIALAQQDDDDRRGDRGFNRNPSGVTVESRLRIDGDRPERAERPDRAPPPQAQPRPDRGDEDRRADRGGPGRGDEGYRGGDRRGPREPAGGVQPAPIPVAQPERGDRGGFRDNDRRRGDISANRGGGGQWRGNDSRAGQPDRRNDARPRGNDDWRGNGGWRGNDDRGRNDWRGNDRRPEVRYDQVRGDRGNWNRGWRQDIRYDWNRRRQVNRNAFHLPRYYAPTGWGYGYRRFDIGFTLTSGLFNRNYWIEDAAYYGLPEAYGPYRWVRYYNDALLIDIYSGQVVDAVYDIFW